MKTILNFVVFITLIGLMASCADKNQFVMSGSVRDRDLNGETIYIYRWDNDDNIEMDSAVINNNKFEIKGLREEPAIFYAYIDAKEVYFPLALGIPVLIKPGKITFEIIGNDAIIGGNAENESYQRLLDKQIPMTEMTEKLNEEFNASTDSAERDSLEVEYNKIVEESNKMITEYLYANIINPFGQNLFLDQYYILSKEQIEELLSIAGEPFVSDPIVKDIIAIMAEPNTSDVQED
ncbi:hypothetical protein M2138_000631 [Dysgonomonadaceae bacterium PH5-43]|nr:hypothetical protein [Dysgonomonadaceae bacterium PH5-43]